MSSLVSYCYRTVSPADTELLPAVKLSWPANFFIGSGSSEGKKVWKHCFIQNQLKTVHILLFLSFNIPFNIILVLVPVRQEVSSSLVSKQKV
jgi:hypothetical protein